MAGGERFHVLIRSRAIGVWVMAVCSEERCNLAMAQWQLNKLLNGEAV